MPAYKSLSDIDLVYLLKSADEAAFTEIYNRYWKKMFTLACHKMTDLEDAKEIVQQIFIRLWERKEKLDIQSSLSSYLSVAVKYSIINALDKQFTRKRYIDSLPALSIVDDSTQEWLEFEEVRERLSKLVSELPEKCRLVFTMSREQGRSQKQIAEALDISEKTVEAHLGKATKALKMGLNNFFFTLI